MSIVLSCGVFAIAWNAKEALIGTFPLYAVMIPFPDQALGTEEIFGFKAHFVLDRGGLFDREGGVVERLVTSGRQGLHLVIIYNGKLQNSETTVIVIFLEHSGKEITKFINGNVQHDRTSNTMDLIVR